MFHPWECAHLCWVHRMKKMLLDFPRWSRLGPWLTAMLLLHALTVAAQGVPGNGTPGTPVDPGLPPVNPPGTPVDPGLPPINPPGTPGTPVDPGLPPTDPPGNPPLTNLPPIVSFTTPDFPTNRPPADLTPCICGPLVGNYVSNQLHIWHVQADGGPLHLRLNTKTVNQVDPQTTVVDVFDGATLVGTVTVSYSAIDAASNPLGWEKSADLNLGVQPPGKVFRLESRVGGTPQTQTHYWLKFCGARWLALESPSFKALEEDHAAFRFRVLPTESLVIDLDNVGIPTPAAGFDWRLIDPTGVIVSSGIAPIVAGPEFNLPTPIPGLWTLELHPVGGEHYLVDKRSGADRHIYLDWYTSQRGAKFVEILLDGHPAMGVPFEVQMLRRRETATGFATDLIRTATATNGAVRLDGLPNGYYDVVVHPLRPGIPSVPSQLDLILCDEPITNRFEFHGTPDDRKLDYGDALSPMYPTLRSEDGARHVIQPGWFLGQGVDAEPDGQPTVRFDGDDLNGRNDDDGVFLPPILAPGSTVSIAVVASTNGVLNAWIDFNRNGNWGDPGDQVFHLQPLVAGTNWLNLVVPPSASNGLAGSRWRFFAVGGLDYGPTGEAPEGEVEDYLVSIGSKPEAVVFGGLAHQPAGGATVRQDPVSGTLRIENLPPDGSGGVQIPVSEDSSRRSLRFDFLPVSLTQPGSQLVISELGTPVNGTSGTVLRRIRLVGGSGRVVVDGLWSEFAPTAMTLGWSAENGQGSPTRGSVDTLAGANVAFLGSGSLIGYGAMVPRTSQETAFSGGALRFDAVMKLEVNGTVVGEGTAFSWVVTLDARQRTQIVPVAGIDLHASLPGGSLAIQAEAESKPVEPPVARLESSPNGGVTLSFQPDPGSEQVIETATNPQGPWVEVTRRPGTFLPEQWSSGVDGSFRLYRVRVLP